MALAALAMAATALGVPIGRASAGPPAPAAAAGAGLDGYATSIPGALSDKLVADPATGRIFAIGSGFVAVVSPTGQLIRTLAIDGVEDITAGGGAIWAVQQEQNVVARIDPSTLALTTWTTTSPYGVYGVAFAGGAVWTSAERTFGGTDVIRLDPATGTFTRHPGDFYGAPMLAASPEAPSKLVLGERHGADHALAVWDVSQPTPVETARTVSETSYLTDLALSPGGAHVLETNESDTSSLVERSVDDLSITHTLAVEGGLASVAASPLKGGTIAVAPFREESRSDDRDDVIVFRRGSWTPSASTQLDALAATSSRDTLAISADGAAVLLLRFRPLATWSTNLHFLPVDPSVRSLAPSVVGTRGGSTVAVGGTTLGATESATVGSTTVTATSSSPTSAAFFAPVLPAGNYPVSLDLGATAAASPAALRVAPLGPFRAGPTFIDRQYRDVLGRTPTAAERATWDGRLYAGTAPGALPAGLVTTPALTKHRTPIIRMLWATGLSPTPARITTWSERYRTGTSLPAAAAAFLAVNPSRPTPNFVDDTYRNVYGRPATTAEIRAGSAKIQAGTSRGQFVVTLATANQAGTAGQVRATELFVGMYRRAPSQAESRTTETTVALATRLLTSAAYANRYPNG